MKILVVAPFPTDPLDAGNRARAANLMAALRADGHEVHYAHLQTGSFDGEAMARRVGADRLHLLPFAPHPPTEPRHKRYLRRLAQRAGVRRAFAWPIDDWYAEIYTPMLRALHDRHRFDAVIVNYVFLTKAFEAFPAPCVHVLDTHDSMGLRHLRYVAIGMRPHWFSTTMEEEERGLRRADLVLAIQEHEAAEFRRRIGPVERPRIVTVGHLIDLPRLAPLPEHPSAVFLGSHNATNVQGLEHYLAHIHPLVRRRLPDFELVVAGPCADHVADRSGLVKLGYVPDLGRAFAAARIFINPVLMGTGVAIKVLDALAHGVPCVCTRSGARGLDREAAAIDIVDDVDAASFAARMVALLTDDGSWRLRRLSARAAAERWNAAQLAALSEVMQELARRHAG